MNYADAEGLTERDIWNALLITVSFTMFLFVAGALGAK